MNTAADPIAEALDRDLAAQGAAAQGDERYRSESQQRILALLMHLGGHELTGLAPGEIAKAFDVNASVVTRDLANLRLAGLAEQMPPANRWRLSPRLVQLATRHMTALDRAERRIEEVRHRFGSAAA